MTDTQAPQDTQAASPSPQDDIDQLIKFAGPQPVIDAMMKNRIRQNIHSQWREQVAARQRKRAQRWGLAVAASIACLALVLTLNPQTTPDTVLAAHVSASSGEVAVGAPSASATRLATQTPLYLGQTITVPKDSGLALALEQGGSLRLDENTQLKITAQRQFQLIHGAAYFDSGLDDHPAIVITTPYGEVTDIGTQFEVRLHPQKLAIKVREGEVELAHNGKVQSGAMQRITENTAWSITQSGEKRSAHIPRNAADWHWAQDLAPILDLEGHNLADYLAWMSREYGWSLEYDSSATEAYAKQNRLHGSINQMNGEQILQVVTAISDTQYALTSGQLRIERKTH